MTKRYCMGCGMPVGEDCMVCPHCGKVVDRQPYSRNATNRPRPAQRNRNAQQRARSAQPPRRLYDERGGYGGYDSYGNYDNYGGHDNYGYGGNERYDDYNSRDVYNEYSEYERGYERPRRPVQSQPPRRTAVRQAAPRQAAPKKTRVLKKIAGNTSKVLRTVGTVLKIAVILAVLYAGIFVIQVYRVKLTGYPYDTKMTLSSKTYGQAISGYFSSGHWSVNPFTGKCTYSGKTYHHEDMELVFTARAKVSLSDITINGKALSDSMIESKIMGMFI